MKAANNNVWIIRHKKEDKIGGVYVPDSAKKEMHRGDIVTVGALVTDKTIKPKRVAIFNRGAGFTIEEKGVNYLILNQMEIVGTDDPVKQ